MTVPAWAAALLRWLAPPGQAEDVLGDLEEAHRGRVQRRGQRTAGVLTGLEALDMAVAFVRERVRVRGGEPHRRRSAAEPRTRSETGSGVATTLGRHRGPIVLSIARDVQIACRALLRARSFSSVVVLTLAVAIGANTAIYSVVEGVLLRPLPYADAERVVNVRTLTLPDAPIEGSIPFSDRGYWHFLENNRAFEQFGGYSGAFQATSTGVGPPRPIAARQMTASLFGLLGTSPELGRAFSRAEDAPGGPDVVLLSHNLWSSMFGSDPEVLGRTIDLDGAAHEVIGVMPPEFDFPSPDAEVWLPFQLDPASDNFGLHPIAGVARLAPGVTLAEAEADAERLIARFGEVGYGPEWFSGIFSGEASVRPIRDEIVGDARQPLMILFGTGAIILLLACSTVANLSLARAEGRTRETAVRLALGSGRRRLVSFLLTESVVLGLLGGTLGALAAYAGIQALVAAAPPMLPRLDEIGFSATVLLFSAMISIAAGLLFGALPAFRTGSPRMLAVLRDGGTGNVQGRGARRTRNNLVVIQVALAMVLVVGSGLLVRSMAKLQSVDPGFNVDNVLTFRVELSTKGYTGPEATARFFDELRTHLETLSGVIAAGGVTRLPLMPGGAKLGARIEEFPIGEDEYPPVFQFRRAAPGYFETMGIPIIEGRTFARRDHEQRLGTLIISESIKEQYWPNTSALGKRIDIEGAPGRVVGVVGDVHDAGLGLPAKPFVYKPMLDSDGGVVLAMTMIVRTDGGDPLSLVPAIRTRIHSMDAAAPMSDIQTLDTIVADSLSRTRYMMTLLALGAAVALFLGAVGIYGVISYLISQRTGEIGIRQALGASVRSVRRMVLRQGLRVAAIGVLIGLIGSVLAGRFLSSFLYGVNPYDPITLAVASTVFLGVAALASAIPAARASRIQPADALRGDPT